MMKKEQIDKLRYLSRKLIRELGMLQLNDSNSKETPGHWHALIEISREPGITISRLGQLLLLSVSTVSRLVKVLAKDGFLDFGEGLDKREKSLYLTENGHAEIKRINAFSDSKIQGAFEFLTEEEQCEIVQSFERYGNALEKSRLMREQVKILTISTSRTLRKQIINMITQIQRDEFFLPITEENNSCVLRAEEEFYHNHSYNFWYAVDQNGRILGSIGLKRIDDFHGEIKKFFVIKEYRGKGVAQKLMVTLLKAALKHNLKFLVLGTVDKLHAAHKFYTKFGFSRIKKEDLPVGFDIFPLDTVFFKAGIHDFYKDRDI